MFHFFHKYGYFTKQWACRIRSRDSAITATNRHGGCQYRGVWSDLEKRDFSVLRSAASLKDDGIPVSGMLFGGKKS